MNGICQCEPPPKCRFFHSGQEWCLADSARVFRDSVDVLSAWGFDYFKLDAAPYQRCTGRICYKISGACSDDRFDGVYDPSGTMPNGNVAFT